MSWRKPALNSEVAFPRSRVAYCDVLLAEARSRTRLGRFDARLHELVFLVREILDDLDTVLVQLNPLHDAPAFATAARLHRDLEQIQAAIPRSNRSRPVPHVRAEHADGEVP
jgi:hypothetical protein